MEFLRLTRVVVQPIKSETVHVALQAFARYGKGRGHPARLNLWDCFIYADARTAGAALLYKGGDFSKTDIESAT
jgi:ribonuclease VapC